MPSADALEAATVDALDTFVELVDPARRLQEALAARGVERPRDEVARAFAAEVRYYLPRSHTGSDAESLHALRVECARVFLTEARAGLDPASFVPDFVGAFEFRLVDGALPALRTLRESGLALACVSNWDVSLHELLEPLGVDTLFDAVVVSAEVGRPKPHPAVFAAALERLGVAPERAVHVGDSPADREGALAAGLRFEPAPLATLPARLGLEGVT